jgi:hypothetical protein
MIEFMAHKENTADKSVPLSCRVEPWIAEGLDTLRNAMKPIPTRSQMIQLALSEWVGARVKAKTRGKEKG